MTKNIVDVVVTLRRDNDYNYNLVKDTFIPEYGEPILVDTARDGLRIKIGDGVTPYGQLDFKDSLFIDGYLHENKFYADEDHNQLVNGIINRLYINNHNGKIYYYNGVDYLLVNGTPNATSTTAGIMMLYDEKGQHTDGTITQRLFTDEINRKYEMSVIDGEELVVFSTSL